MTFCLLCMTDEDGVEKDRNGIAQRFTPAERVQRPIPQQTVEIQSHSHVASLMIIYKET